MARVASIWRAPIKSHSREEVTEAALTPGQGLPCDRLWAVAHSESAADGSTWVPCQNFSRVTKSAGLGAITSALAPDGATITLSHPDLPDLTFRPDDEPEALITWSAPLIPEGRAPSARIVRGRTRGFSDSDFPSITLCNLASHRAVEGRVGQPLSIHRWRGNIWIDGLDLWEEFEWIDREVRVGGAILRVRERTDRCLATHNNPDTGRRDLDILSALDSFGHRDFSVRAEVIRAGTVRTGDPVHLA